jgi:formylglycine-generating enzyme required for sulfatase activity
MTDHLMMNDLRFAFRQPLTNPGFAAVAALTLGLGAATNTPAFGHPGSGIVVDRQGRVYFTDTGQGVWKIDEQGRLSSHEGSAYHFMAIDPDDWLARTPWPAFREPSTDIQRVGANPTLLLSSDFPLTTGRDGSSYFPELGKDGRLRVFQLTPSGDHRVVADLPAASDGPPLKWLNGMAAGPDGAIYFSENAAVRRITPQGEVITMASNIVVPDCRSPPGANPRLGPFLRGLDVAADGTVYVAANGCCAVLQITAQGQVTPVLRTTSPWSPTGVAVSGDLVYVLEYLHTASGDRREWTPRVRKLSGDGTATIVAAVERLGAGASRAAPVPGTNSFVGARAGDEIEVQGVRLCWCLAGRFVMGSPRSEPERRPGEDQVEVTLTKGFWMAKYEATQGQWKRVMGKLPGPLTAELPEGDDFPVGNVNFAEAEAFCRKLTELGRQAAELPRDWEFRLPTEAQWEYACRAGTTTATAFGDKLSSRQANFKGKPYNGGELGPSLNRAAKVGSYPANAWGLHDMHGNIFEWCRDWYHSRLPGGVDPDLHSAESTAVLNRTGDRSRVRRGGAWTDDGWPCRSAFRLRFEPHRRYDHIGFRVVAVRP